MSEDNELSPSRGATTMEKLFFSTRLIHSAGNRAELIAALSESFLTFGFGSFNLGLHKLDKHELTLDATLMTWSNDFVVEFERKNWAENNPMLDRAIIAEHPFCWSVNDRHQDRLKQSYIDYLVTTPLKGGISVPLPRRPGTVSSISVESHTRTEFSDADISTVALIANSAMMRAETLGLCRQVSIDEAQARDALTPVQVEILKWAAAGKSNLDIAMILNMTKRNVEYHMSQIFRKFSVASRSQAVATFLMSNSP
ncbi:MAG: autoinducer binding domain-containing protein [Devosia sp.]|nr:autoinducer binding domain-containing protein [Devosia sp.]